MGSRMWVSCTRCFVTCSSVAVDYLGRFLRTFERRPAKSEAKIVAKVLVGSKGLWNTQLTIPLYCLADLWLIHVAYVKIIGSLSVFLDTIFLAHETCEPYRAILTRNPGQCCNDTDFLTKKKSQSCVRTKNAELRTKAQTSRARTKLL